MNNTTPYQISYYFALKNLIDNYDKKVQTRVGVARSLFSEKMKIDLKEEFPLMEVKQLSFKNIVVELLWFLKGDTNIKYLIENKCNIWNDDAFRWYNEKYVPKGAPSMTKEEFLEKVKNGEKYDFTISKSVAVEANFGYEQTLLDHTYTYGDLDIVYGRQWRNFGGKVDQIVQIINKLKSDPDDRRMILLGHNPADIADGNVGLPACHNYAQFYTQPMPFQERIKIAKQRDLLEGELLDFANKYVFYTDFEGDKMTITKEVIDQINVLLDNLGIEKRYLSTFLTIRSNDFFLGNPYNVASYAILTYLIAQCVNMKANTLSVEMVDCHLYEDHIDAAQEWLARFDEFMNTEANSENINTVALCKSKLLVTADKRDIDSFVLEDFNVEGYSHGGKIVAPLLT